MTVGQIYDAAIAIRDRTQKPFALNFLMFSVEEDCYAAALKEKPAAIALAWPRPDQDLKRYIDRAHDVGCKVTLMAGGVPEAERGVAAGADVIIAQGTEAGGHVGWMVRRSALSGTHFQPSAPHSARSVLPWAARLAFCESSDS